VSGYNIAAAIMWQRASFDCHVTDCHVTTRRYDNGSIDGLNDVGAMVV